MKYQLATTATGYDRIIGMPVIRSIRAAEGEVVNRVFHEHVRPIDTILEVGAGTGYYTLGFARAAGRVTALDSNPSMVEHLQGEARRRDLRNIEIVAGDFLTYPNGTTHDWVVALGVLEYQENPSEFLNRIISFSHKWVLVTFPAHGIWGRIYRATSRMHGSHVTLFRKSELQRQYNSSIVHMEDVGLKSRVCGGMTLVCLIERK